MLSMRVLCSGPIAFVDKSELYEYYPRLIDENVFEPLYDEVQEKVATYNIVMRDKIFEARRLSCIISSLSKTIYDENYEDGSERLPCYAWEDVPIVSEIREYVQHVILKEGERSFDYALVHLYRDGTDYIGYHSDSEAMNTSVVSVSMGATRRFRFREKDTTRGWYDDIELHSGDVVHMLPSCQKYFKHAVPKQLRVLKPRINITFRYNV